MSSVRRPICLPGVGVPVQHNHRGMLCEQTGSVTVTILLGRDPGRSRLS